MEKDKKAFDKIIISRIDGWFKFNLGELSSYNIPESDIVKYANDCDEKMGKLIEKQFKKMKPKVDTIKKDDNLSADDKAKLVDMVTRQPSKCLTQIVKIISKARPYVIEDIDNDKVQIKVNFLTYKEFGLIKEYIEKANIENNAPNNDKDKSD